MGKIKELAPYAGQEFYNSYVGVLHQKFKDGKVAKDLHQNMMYKNLVSDELEKSKDKNNKTVYQLQVEEETGIGPQRRHDEATKLVTSQTDKLIGEIQKFLTNLSPQTFATNLANAIKEVFEKLKFELHFEVQNGSVKSAKQPAATKQEVQNIVHNAVKKLNDFDTEIASLIREQNVVLRNIDSSFNSIKDLIEGPPTGQKGNTLVFSTPSEKSESKSSWQVVDSTRTVQA